ncbi:unnamed protein product [Blepharisma stoltei]|uniref:Histidine kinase n=1 Tax=Blepharisma stoltei TaxID=1481888 RepID=A0AAU9IRJ8_9CILI|nr:unnamed protein product [Blepharisma stoltei]
MKDGKSNWLQEEIEGIYLCLIRFSKFFMYYFLLSIIWNVFLQQWQFWKYIFAPIFVFTGLITVFIRYASNKDIKYKAIVSIIYAEYFNLSLNCISLYIKEQKSTLEIIALLMVTFFQFTMIRNKWIFNLMVLKFLYLWEYHGIFFRNEQRSLPLNSTCLFIGILNYGHSHLMNIAYERYAYRKELESSRNRLDTITQSISDGILVISYHKVIEFYNSYTINLLGTSSENLFETLSKIHYCENKKVSNFTTTEFLTDDIDYLLENYVNEEITLGITLIGNNNLVWKACKIQWEGKSALFLTIKNSNQIIELEKKLSNGQMKNLLLRSVSHELKTPLNSITYFTNDLLSNFQKEANEEFKKLKIISVSSKLMLSLTNDLLDYSKILAGSFSIQKSFFNLRESIKSICELFHYQAEKKKLQFIIRLAPELPEFIYTDPLRFNQIILNLLSNAIKYTLKGKIEICCISTVENKLKCFVEDSGIGIEKNAATNLFNCTSCTSIPVLTPTGCGLGLYISNLLVKELGGKSIEVSSIPGKGSVFYFSIDYFENSFPNEFCDTIEDYDNEEASTFVMSGQDYIDSSEKEVLIVDDMELNLEILASILSRNCITYDEALNGKCAVEKVISQDMKDKPYKVILMDCEMPEMNGWEAAKTIDQLFCQGKLRTAPRIIGYSAYTSDEDIRLCFQSGMVNFLPKPSTPDSIIKAIKTHLQS